MPSSSWPCEPQCARLLCRCFLEFAQTHVHRVGDAVAPSSTRKDTADRHEDKLRGPPSPRMWPHTHSEDAVPARAHLLRDCSESGSGGAVLSPVRLLAKPRIVAHQSPLSTGLSRREYWSGIPGHAPPARLRPAPRPKDFQMPAPTLRVGKPARMGTG